MTLLAAALCAALGTARGEPVATVLEKLAERADVHRSLLYEMNCVERVTREVHRRRESAAGFGLQPDQRLQAEHGIAVVRDQDGDPRERRVKLDRNGAPRLDRRGRPLEAKLSRQLDPIARAFPHAQVSWFGADEQHALRFSRIEDPDPKRYTIDCKEPDTLALEFFDRTPPRREGPLSEPRCTARVSGQMCLGLDGEIRSLATYGLYFDGETCQWDRERPFATIVQRLVEPTTGLRFPSRVETVYPLDWRDTAIFVQLFTDCAFTRVRVATSVDR